MRITAAYFSAWNFFKKSTGETVTGDIISGDGTLQAVDDQGHPLGHLNYRAGVDTVHINSLHNYGYDFNSGAPVDPDPIGGVGSGLLDNLSNQFPDKRFVVVPSPQAENFYKDRGFGVDPDNGDFDDEDGIQLSKKPF